MKVLTFSYLPKQVFLAVIVFVSMALVLFMYSNTAMAQHGFDDPEPPSLTTLTLDDDTEDPNQGNSSDLITSDGTVTLSNPVTHSYQLNVRYFDLVTGMRDDADARLNSSNKATLPFGDYSHPEAWIRYQLNVPAGSSGGTSWPAHYHTSNNWDSPGFIVDNIPPATPTVATLVADTGFSDSDVTTSNRFVRITPTEPLGTFALWQYSVGTTVSWNDGNNRRTGDTNADTFPLASDGADKVIPAGTIQIRQVDEAGNISGAFTVFTNTAITIDQTAPAVPTAFAPEMDTGVSSSDRETSDPTIVVTGTSVGASDVRIGYIIGSEDPVYTSFGASNFELPTDATYGANFKIFLEDRAGNTSGTLDGSGTREVILDRVAPSNSSLGIDLATDTGAFNNDYVTNDATIKITLDGGEQWQFAADTQTSGTLTWSANQAKTTTTFELPGDGDYQSGRIRIRQLDKAGNFSNLAFLSTEVVTLDTVGPSASTGLGLSLNSDSGNSSDFITNDNQINVAGGPTMMGESFEFQTSTTGKWMTGTGSSFTLPDGLYKQSELKVRVTDVAGNVGSEVAFGTSGNVVIDTAVLTPTLTLTDTGISATDAITNDGTFTVGNVDTDAAGGAPAVQYRLNSGAWMDATTSGGVVSFEITTEDTYNIGTIEVRQIDTANNTSTVFPFAKQLVLDKTDPPVITASSVLANTGVSNTDNVTNANQLTFNLEDNGVVEFSINGGTNWTGVIGSTLTLPDDTYTVADTSFRQADLAGNTSTPLASTGVFANFSGTVEIDTLSPTSAISFVTQTLFTLSLQIDYSEEVFNKSGEALSLAIDGNSYPIDLSSFVGADATMTATFNATFREAGTARVNLASGTGGGTDRAGNGIQSAPEFTRPENPTAGGLTIATDDIISASELSSVVVTGYGLAVFGNPTVNVSALGVVSSVAVSELGTWSTTLTLPKDLFARTNLLRANPSRVTFTGNDDTGWTPSPSALHDGDKKTLVTYSNVGNSTLSYDFSDQNYSDGSIVITAPASTTINDNFIITPYKDGVVVPGEAILGGTLGIGTDSEITIELDKNVVFDRIDIRFDGTAALGEDPVHRLSEIAIFGSLSENKVNFRSVLTAPGTATTINNDLEAELASDIDWVAPTLNSASLSGSNAVLSFSENLLSSSVSASDFIVTDAEGNNVLVNSASVAGSNVTLALEGSPVAPLTISLAGNGVSDTSSNLLRSSAAVKTNVSFGVVSSRVAGDNVVLLEFAFPVDVSSAESAFTSGVVTIGTQTFNVSQVLVSGKYLSLVTAGVLPAGSGSVTTTGVINNVPNTANVPTGTNLPLEDARTTTGVTLTSNAPSIALVDESITKINVNEGVIASVDLSLLTDNTTRKGDLEITYGAGDSRVDVLIPEFTTFSGVGTSGVVLGIDDKTNANRCPGQFEGNQTVVSCVAFGSDATTIQLSNPIRLSYNNEGRFNPYFSTAENPTMVVDITTACVDTNASGSVSQSEAVNTLSASGANECFANESGDMIIWTNHLTNFGTYQVVEDTFFRFGALGTSSLLPATGEGSVALFVPLVAFGALVLLFGVVILVRNTRRTY